MIGVDDLVDSHDSSFLAGLASRLNEETDPAVTLRRVAECAREVAGCGEAALLLTRGRTIAIAASTIAAAREAELVQAEIGEGPALLAIKTGEPQLSGTIADDDRWPSWGPRTASIGFASVFALRLRARGSTLGALSFYSGCSDAYDPALRGRITLFTHHASIVIAASAYADGLCRAVDSHALVGQAQGILMEKYRMSADAAFRVLRRYSQNRNIKLRSLAESVIATRKLPEA